MLEISKAVLERHLVRKSREQKRRFEQLLRERYPELTADEGGLLRSRNLVIGDPQSAKIVFCAHYDTCARLPVPNLLFPMSLPLTLLYGLLLAVPFAAVGFGLGVLSGAAAGLLGLPMEMAAALAAVLMVALMGFVFFFGPANPNTFNDNSSGVVTLLELLGSLTPRQREKAAFIFFDNEELGLLGSSGFARRHREIAKERLVINLDCVSDGDNLLLVQSREAEDRFGPLLAQAFQPREGKKLLLERQGRAFYPSDQMNFKLGVGVAAFRRGPLGLYISRIHTKRDTVFEEENIELLAEGGRRLIDLL